MEVLLTQVGNILMGIIDAAKKHSGETKERMSKIAKNMSDETKEKISEALQGNENALGYKHTDEAKQKLSEINKGKELSVEHKREISEALQGNTNSFGYKQTAEAILNRSLAQIKYDPDYSYCEIWKDKEYRKDIRKDYCENIDCKKDYKRLDNHHIYLDKKKCKPIDIMTMCASCHAILHKLLQRGKNKAANPKDYIIINRPDHVSYIYKKSHEIIRINKKELNNGK